MNVKVKDVECRALCVAGTGSSCLGKINQSSLDKTNQRKSKQVDT